MKAPNLFYSIAIYLLLWPCQSQRIISIFLSYSYWFISFSCPCRRNITYEGVLWLVKALLFLKENFSFFSSIHSSLYCRQIGADTKKEEALTALANHHSKEHPLWFPYSTGKRTHTKFICSLQRQHTQLNPHSHIRQNPFGQQEGIILSA